MANSNSADFDKNVFINCPFDDDYTRLLHPLLFTILYLGFNPRIATESTNTNNQRIDRICELIKISKYSIHDISRLRSTKKNQFYRLNMSFELGIFYGCQRFATNHHKNKQFLVIEKDQYKYAIALSDLAGVDIKSHNNEPFKVIEIVRNWLAGFIKKKTIDASEDILKNFDLFMRNLAEERDKKGFTKYNMPVSEFIGYIRKRLHPLAPGLNSTAIITGGNFVNSWSNIPNNLIEFNFTVKSGKIFRDENGNLKGNIVVRSPIVSTQEILERIGADKQDFISEESTISTDSSKPTVFTATPIYPDGVEISGHKNEQDVITYSIKTTLKGHLQNLTFKGTFDAVWEADVSNISFETKGSFEIYLS